MLKNSGTILWGALPAYLAVIAVASVAVALQGNSVPPQEPANRKLLSLSKKLGIPIVATNDNHYTRKEDAEAQEILLCIQTQSTINDKNRKLSMIDSPDFYIKSGEEMEKLFIETPEAIENANKIG